MDPDDDQTEEGVWFVPRRWHPLCLVGAISLLACGVTASVHQAVDYLDTTIAAAQAHAEEQQDMADSVRVDIESLPEA